MPPPLGFTPSRASRGGEGAGGDKPLPDETPTLAAAEEGRPAVYYNKYAAAFGFVTAVLACSSYDTGKSFQLVVNMLVYMPLSVYRGGIFFNSFYGFISVFYYLIHSDDDDKFVGAEAHSGYTVAMPVNAHDFPVQGEGIGAGDEDIGG